jgi:3-oxoacyl-[acyl-carrier-protein] synthase II
MNVAIQGIGAVGAFGCGVADLRRAVQQGDMPVPAMVASGQGAAEVPVLLADTAPLEEFIPKRSLRRIDHFSKLALLGAYLALQDAGVEEAQRKRLGVVIATGYGAMRTTFSFLDSFIDGGDVCSSPTHFSSSVHNAAAANISILLGVTGPSLTVSQFEMSVPSALLTARRWLAEERVESVLVGGVDEAGEVLAHCWRRYFGVPDGVLRPLEFARQSALPGEGAAFLLLGAGGEAKYGYLADVVQGNLAGGLPKMPEHLILGADGHRECGALYSRQIPDGTRTAAYAPLYGSLPAAPALDLAIAALAVEEDRLYSTPGEEAPHDGLALNGNPVGVLKLGRGGDFGLLAVRR